MGGVTDLFDALVEFFEVCKTALAETAGGLPDCAYLSEGPPAWDSCPCLVVYAGMPAIGDTLPLQPALGPLHRAVTTGHVNLVAMTAIALRCSPIPDDSGNLPSPQEHATATREILEDAWALWNHLFAAKKAGTLFPPTTREFTLEPGIALNPQGQVAGASITCRTELGGYVPTP